MADKMDYILIKDLCKTYYKGTWKKDKVEALKKVNLSIKKGEIFGILGPNGAGKTTLMNILMGLIIPDSGEVIIANELIRKRFSMDLKRRMNMCSGNPNLPWSLTVKETLKFYSFLYNLKSKEAENKINFLIKELNLEKYIDVRFDELSTGNKQKLSLAKALINDPEILLLDEPTLGLDPDISKRTRRFIKDLHLKNKTTILLTTHYMKEAEELCDRIAFIKDGRIIAIGSKSKIKKLTKTENLEEAFIELAHQQN